MDLFAWATPGPRSRPPMPDSPAGPHPRRGRAALAAALTAVVALLVHDTAFARGGGPPWLLGFDEVPAGTAVNELYAGRGVHLQSFGDGLLGAVIADTACIATPSAPNALSLRPVDTCGTYSEAIGWIRATFNLPQPRVSVVLTNAGNGVASYLRGYKGSSLVDMIFGQSGPKWNGVPQTLEIRRPAGHTLIDYVEFGAFRGSDPVQADDLSYDLRPVPNGAASWGTLKARFP